MMGKNCIYVGGGGRGNKNKEHSFKMLGGGQPHVLTYRPFQKSLYILLNGKNQ